MFGLFNTPTENKRDEYYSLYQSLKGYQKDVEKKLTEANESFSNYSSSVPNLSNSKVPSRYFDPKREELSKELSTYIQKETEKKQSLASAKEQAKAQYEKYKALAIQEAEEKRAREAERARKERADREKARAKK